MGETINYGLYVEDDDSVLFKDWRKKINGSTNSSMVKIDALLKALFDQGISEITRTESSESGGENKLTITLGSGEIIELVSKNGTDGASGIYVGDGDMPDGYALQILPSGGSIPAPDVISGGHYTPSVTQVDESTIKFTFTPSLEDMSEISAVTITIPSGKDGYTPQKGVDYWTESDKDEIKTYVDNLILGGEW